MLLQLLLVLCCCCSAAAAATVSAVLLLQLLLVLCCCCSLQIIVHSQINAACGVVCSREIQFEVLLMSMYEYIDISIYPQPPYLTFNSLTISRDCLAPIFHVKNMGRPGGYMATILLPSKHAQGVNQYHYCCHGFWR